MYICCCNRTDSSIAFFSKCRKPHGQVKGQSAFSKAAEESRLKKQRKHQKKEVFSLVFILYFHLKSVSSISSLFSPHQKKKKNSWICPKRHIVSHKWF